MINVNDVRLIGFLGSNPEFSVTTTSNREVCNLSLATTKRWTDDQTGEVREKTEWHRLVLWQPHLIKTAHDYLRKGAFLYIEGELNSREWEKDGQKHRTTDIVVQKIGFLDRKDDGE